MFLQRNRAQEFFLSKTARASFGCTNSACCRRGVLDMIGDPRRHFVVARMGEVAMISSATASVRGSVYLDRILRPATDRLGRAQQYSSNKATRERIESERRKLDGWRETLGELARTSVGSSHALVPRSRRSR
jgi:hypothetical protein